MPRERLTCADVMFENGANTVVNGVRESFNGFLINGVSNKGLSGGPINQPIQDTVQEFQLVTLNNSAEFSNSAGAITSLVTKSGTNLLHGSAWEYFRNDALDANPFFANHVPDPANRQEHSFAPEPVRRNRSAEPIIRNKLFFFGAYQGDRFLTSSAAPVQVESPQFRSAATAAFPDSVASLLYKNFPPSTQGTPLMTLRDYVTGSILGIGFFPIRGLFVSREASTQAPSILPLRRPCRTDLRSCSEWSRPTLTR